MYYKQRLGEKKYYTLYCNMLREYKSYAKGYCPKALRDVYATSNKYFFVPNAYVYKNKK